MSSAKSEVRRARSLALRLTWWYVALFVATLAVLASIAVPTVHHAIEREDAVVVETTVERHLAVLVTRGLPAYRSAVEDTASLTERDVVVRVRDADGNTLYEHGDMTASLRTASRASQELRIDLGTTDDPWRGVLDRLRPWMIALACAAFVLAIVGGYSVTRRALQPVRELAATARQVTVAADLSRRVPERGGGDELDELTRLFNKMLERNQRLVHGMREALDNVAHDLRTPLTRMRGGAEVALRSDDPAAAREALADSIEEADRVLAMLRTLMDISEAETGIMRLEIEEVSLAAVARDVVGLYEQVAEDAGVDLRLASDVDASAEADRTRLRQAIANLVDNAIKYTPRGGRVELGVEARGDDAVIRVRDTGEGIASDALPRIWDRLYRADQSRSRPGLGLGLSLVKAIVTAHRGQVEVESEPGKGSTFTISIPRQRAVRS